MPGPGRNHPCRCGSGRKTKHCCGEQRGPSEAQLARAHVAQLARHAIPDLAGLSDHALDHLSEGLMDLPALDLSLLVTLPKLIGPDLERLREAIEHDDPDWGWDALTRVHQQIDTPDNGHASPTRSSVSATNARSTAGKPPTRCSTSTPAPPVSSPPACSKPSPSRSASTAPLAASTSPP
ncbi:MAG TPA: hypothetical protein VFY45_17565, partial [Baekduia sp.]|nr:hypothetical protein [Baekduia sp.]